MMQALSWLLGIEELQSVDRFRLALTAPWIQGKLFWLALACGGLIVGATAFYLKLQHRGSRRVRFCLGVWRGALLSLLLVTLASPVLELTGSRLLRPLVYVVVDATDSMNLEDDYEGAEAARLQAAVGARGGEGPTPLSRLDYARAWLRDPSNPLAKLQAGGSCDVEAFVFDGRNTSQLRKVDARDGQERVSLVEFARSLDATGQVTALEAVLDDVGRQLGAGRLEGIVMLSDYAHNGPAPLVGGGAALERFETPIYAVGIGAVEAVDAGVELLSDAKMKPGMPSTLTARVSQAGLAGQTARLTLAARGLSGDSVGSQFTVGVRDVVLRERVTHVDFPFTPQSSGELEMTVELATLAGESATQNNRASRRVDVIDDYLRLMFVSYEPTWEWRFVKEVFHRDKLVGMDGFRTYLASSDPRVRKTNVLFLETLTPPRSEFFLNDVVFLGDMPRNAMNDRFAEMLREWVSDHGGGLVVMAGARFGTRQLLGTPLIEMLPVVLDPDAAIRDGREFSLQKTPFAERYPFMKLGDTASEDRQAWAGLSHLPFYQPVRAVHPQATIVARHPTDACADGRTPQPLIAIRQFGKGQVVYLAFDEMWRLRRLYGEKYYTRFWQQLIYRLGMSHALGADKRFRVALNSQRYRSEDEVTLRVDAYDENYQPLSPEKLGGATLVAELVSPEAGGGAATSPLSIPYLRRGVFEARFPVFQPGDYVLRITDPVSREVHQRRFEVTSVSAERLRVVRDAHLQSEVAQATGGQAYDLTTVSRLADDLELSPTVETQTRDHPLWNTPLWFGLLVLGLLGEWLVRKLVHLS